MGRNNNDFHNWQSAVDDTTGQKVEVSNTSRGTYKVSGKGAGSMKWSVTHDPSGWEALGRTRGEVRGEADRHLSEENEKDN